MSDRFTFFESFAKSTRKLPPEDFKAVMLAVFDYAFEGKETEDFPSEWAESVYSLITPVVKKGKANQENGNQGGRPKETDGSEDKKASVSDRKKGGLSKPKRAGSESSKEKEMDNGKGDGIGIQEMETEEESGVGDITPHNPPTGGGTGVKPQTLQEKRFEGFWSEYPKKVGKEAARRSWRKINPNTGLYERMIRAVRDNIAGNPQWRKDNGQYIPNPATWLNQGRWEDELTRIQVREKSIAEQWMEA